jgi:transcription termination/antitermination protein NusG
MAAAANFRCEPESEQAVRWYGIHTRHQHEMSVASILSNKGFKVFYPTYESVRKWKDRNKKLSLPLFPGYVFLADDVEKKLLIVSTPGVCAILSFAGQPAVIPASEIEPLQRSMDCRYKLTPHPFLNTGDRLRIKSGPLAGTEGILTRKKDVYRLVLSVEMLGRSAAVEIDAAVVERTLPARPQ